MPLDYRLLVIQKHYQHYLATHSQLAPVAAARRLYGEKKKKKAWTGLPLKTPPLHTACSIGRRQKCDALSSGRPGEAVLCNGAGSTTTRTEQQIVPPSTVEARRNNAFH